MCGIAGVIGHNSINKRLAKRVLRTLSHRGPDGEGIEKVSTSNHGDLNLFFSRLAILDLDSRAMQPMRFQHFTILMNGEIYNYRELRNRIEYKFGFHDWLTTGDIEVALKYLVYFGVDAIKDFDGMFALALWNHEENELVLARDYFGEKPLHYAIGKGEVSFASEPKTLFVLSSNHHTLNMEKISNFIANGYKYLYKQENGFFHGINQVKPGHIVVFKEDNLNNPTIHSYKQLPPENPIQGESRVTAIERIRRSVIKSVGLRLESDVPISISLSGGIDSCLIAAIAKKDFGVSLHAFTLASKDSRYSEEEIARSVSKFLDIEHTIVQIESKNFLSQMKEIIRYHDSPISTISYYIQNTLMKKIHESGFKVSLSGTGADELFSGYYDHHLLYLSELFRKDKIAHGKALRDWTTNILPLVRNPIYRNASLYIEDPNYRKHIFDGHEYNRDLIKQSDIWRFSEHEFSTSLMRNRMLNELFHEVIPVILKEDDRNSMMYAIENRSPYLSYEILSESLKTDTRHFIHEGKTKSLLREAFDGYLPDRVIKSFRKIGFNTSFSEICDVMSEEFQEFINDNSIYWEFVDRDKAKEIFRCINNEDYFNKTAFNLVSAKVFVDNMTSKIV